MTPTTTAQLLAHFRVSNRPVPVAAAEAFLLIAAGVDHVEALRQAMPDAAGQPCPRRTVYNLINALKGRSAMRDGRLVPSPFSWVEARPHPHRQGQQLLLTGQGRALVQAFFPDFQPPNPIAN